MPMQCGHERTDRTSPQSSLLASGPTHGGIQKRRVTEGPPAHGAGFAVPGDGVSREPRSGDVAALVGQQRQRLRTPDLTSLPPLTASALRRPPPTPPQSVGWGPRIWQRQVSSRVRSGRSSTGPLASASLTWASALGLLPPLAGCNPARARRGCKTALGPHLTLTHLPDVTAHPFAPRSAHGPRPL